MRLKYVLIWPVCLFMFAACFKSKSKEGVQVTLQAITEDAIRKFTDESTLRMKELLKRNSIAIGSLKGGQLGQFLIEGYNPDHEARIRDILDEYFREWNFSAANGTAAVSLKTEAGRIIRNEVMDQTLEVLHSRLNEMGVSHPILERLPGDKISLEMRSGDDNTDRILGILTTRGYLEWKLVQAGPSADEASLLNDFGGQVPEDMEILRCDPKRMESGYYLVNRVAGVTGRDIRSVHKEKDQWGNPAVGFELSADGAQRFSLLTGENIGRQVAIVLDGLVQSAPVVQSRIEDRGIISGRFTESEVEDLITMLRSGGLPAGVKVLEIKKI
jgi:preprotein translocase subunit SecD